MPQSTTPKKKRPKLENIGLKQAKKGRTKKPISRGKLVKELDARFSRFIRLKYSDENGMVECVTSGERLHRKSMQCGHFISRGNYRYRWDETNCHPQTYRDNCLLKGNYIKYTLFMIQKIGKEAVDHMVNDKSLCKIHTREIQEKIAYYKSLVENNPLYSK